MSHSAEGVRNGHFQIHLSDDFMKAEVDLFPPSSGGKPFTVQDVLSELESAGVTWGTDSKGLEKAILRCLTEETAVRGIVAALGRKPVKAVPSYWHLKKRLIATPQADVQSMNIDYKDQSPYVLVKKGEPLAKQIPEAPGEPGRNLGGEVLPAGNKDIVQFRPGENTIEKDGILYAACHGRFEIRERQMAVNETLDIAGNVDYSTGHIAFPGDVIIHGSVCDGFRVASGRSIFVKQTMDASKVLSRGDLVVEGGIKGRTDALVRVDGRISAKFIENASVEAHGEIVVEKSVMHSDIFTLNHVDLGEAGVLVGGEIWALNGLRAGRIGRPESPAAGVRVGSDYIVERKLHSSREQIDRLEAKLDKLKAKVTIDAEREKLITQVETVLEKLKQTESELANQRHPNRNALVIVFGEVGEGTEIHIGDLTMRTSTPMDGVVFYYEEDGPRIATRDIADSDKGPLPGSGDGPDTGDDAGREDSEPADSATADSAEKSADTESADTKKPSPAAAETAGSDPDSGSGEVDSAPDTPNESVDHPVS